jgi:hypothetical protein
LRVQAQVKMTTPEPQRDRRSGASCHSP